jgi:hypothetical protein
MIRGAQLVSNGPFTATLSFTRPANTTQYTAKDIINANAAITLPYFDLSAYGANRKVLLSFLSFRSDNYAVKSTAPLKPDCRIYGMNNPVADCTDNLAFNPSWDNLDKLMAACNYSDADTFDIGTSGYVAGRWEGIAKIVTTDANGYLYFAALDTAAYTPASGEKFRAHIAGFVQ